MHGTGKGNSAEVPALQVNLSSSIYMFINQVASELSHFWGFRRALLPRHVALNHCPLATELNLQPLCLPGGFGGTEQWLVPLATSLHP